MLVIFKERFYHKSANTKHGKDIQSGQIVKESIWFGKFLKQKKECLSKARLFTDTLTITQIEN